jgi:hypothetical protein
MKGGEWGLYYTPHYHLNRESCEKVISPISNEFQPMSPISSIINWVHWKKFYWSPPPFPFHTHPPSSIFPCTSVPLQSSTHCFHMNTRLWYPYHNIRYWKVCWADWHFQENLKGGTAAGRWREAWMATIVTGHSPSFRGLSIVTKSSIKICASLIQR